MDCQKYSILFMFCIKIKKEEKPSLGILPPINPEPEPIERNPPMDKTLITA